MVIWAKDQTIQSEFSDTRKVEDPYVYFGCVAVSKVNNKTFRLGFLDQSREKLTKMEPRELLFYLSTILEAVEIDVVNNSYGKSVNVRDFFAFKFLVETIVSLIQDKSLGTPVGVESSGRYNIAKGSSNDQV